MDLQTTGPTIDGTHLQIDGSKVYNLSCRSITKSAVGAAGSINDRSGRWGSGRCRRRHPHPGYAGSRTIDSHIVYFSGVELLRLPLLWHDLRLIHPPQSTPLCLWVVDEPTDACPPLPINIPASALYHRARQGPAARGRTPRGRISRPLWMLWACGAAHRHHAAQMLEPKMLTLPKSIPYFRTIGMRGVHARRLLTRARTWSTEENGFTSSSPMVYKSLIVPTAIASSINSKRGPPSRESCLYSGVLLLLSRFQHLCFAVIKVGRYLRIGPISSFNIISLGPALRTAVCSHLTTT